MKGCYSIFQNTYAFLTCPNAIAFDWAMCYSILHNAVLQYTISLTCPNAIHLFCPIYSIADIPRHHVINNHVWRSTSSTFLPFCTPFPLFPSLFPPSLPPLSSLLPPLFISPRSSRISASPSLFRLPFSHPFSLTFFTGLRRRND